MKKALSTKSHHSEANKKKNSKDVDSSSAVILVLNGIIFQYLELQCLDETYRTFYDECRALGLPIPPEIPSEVVSYPDSYYEVQKLFLAFDEEDGNSILQRWTNIMPELGDDNLMEQKKINVLLRIYVALIPHRKNQKAEVKNEAMKALKEFFESNAGDSLDEEEMLAYFALPYIPDIKTHPVLKNLLEDEWMIKLRQRLEVALSKLYSQKNSLHPLDSDLARLYFLWTKGKNHLMNDADGNCWTFRCVSLTENCPPDVPYELEANEDTVNDESSSVDLFFETIVKLSRRNRRLLESHRELQAKYSETTDLCCVLLNALCRSRTGEEVDMEGLQKAVENCPSIHKKFQENQKKIEVRDCDDFKSPIVPKQRHLCVETYKEKYSRRQSQDVPIESLPPSTRKASVHVDPYECHKDSKNLKQVPSNKIIPTARSESTNVIYKAGVRPKSRSAPSTSRTYTCHKFGDDEDDSGNTTDTLSEELFFEGINMDTFRNNSSRIE